MTRREFPASVKVAVVKRATRNGVVYCEECNEIAKKWQIDHEIADSHGGKPVLDNAKLLCEPCYNVKNPRDTTIAAKLKRIEAKHLGIKKKSTFRRPLKEKPEMTKVMPRRPIYE